MRCHIPVVLALAATVAAQDTVSIQAWSGGAQPSEGSSPSLRLVRDGSAGALTVRLSWTGAGADVTGAATTAVIPDGQSSLILPYGIVDDATPENDEQVLVSLVADAAYAIDQDQPAAQLTIPDNDGFTRAMGFAGNGATAAFQYAYDEDVLTFSVPADGVVRIEALPAAGTAVNGYAYLYTGGGSYRGYLSFTQASGSTSLFLAAGAYRLESVGYAEGSVRFLATASPDRISAAFSPQLAQEGGTIRLDLQRLDTTQSRMVALQWGGSALAAIPGLPASVTFAAGSSGTSVTLAIPDDAVAEDDQGLTATVATTSGYAPAESDGIAGGGVGESDGFVRILQADVPEVGTIEAAGDVDDWTFTTAAPGDWRIGLGGVWSGLGTTSHARVQITNAAGTVDHGTVYAYSYQDGTFQVTLPAGEFRLRVTGYEPGTYWLAVQPEQTFTVAAVAGEVVEGAPLQVVVLADRTSVRTKVVRFGFSNVATPASGDLAAVVSATMPAGADSVVVAFPTLADGVDEGVENATITLQATADCAVGYPSSATIRIADPGGRILRVRTGAAGAATGLSWADAFPHLEQALAIARPEDQVWIAAGTYRPTAGTDRNASFVVPERVTVHGGFAGIETALGQRDIQANPVILSGDIGSVGSAGDNSYTVVRIPDAGSALTGVTVSGAFGGYAGGGIVVSNSQGSVTTIADCVVSGNETTTYGGGILGSGSSPLRLLRVQVLGNRTGSYGAGVSLSYGGALVENCLIAGNELTGQNSRGAGLYTDTYSTYYGVVDVVHTTIAGNRATATGATYAGAYAYYGGSMAWTGSLLWGNLSASGPSFYLPITPASGLIEGWTGGGAVLTADPLFTDPAGDDWSLQPGSPAIDQEAQGPAQDLFRRARSGLADLGAIESQAGAAVADGTAPTAAVLVPAQDPMPLTGAAITVSGTAADARGVAAVAYELAGATTGGGYASGTAAWSIPLTALNPGLTTVRISVWDLAGNVRRLERRLDYRQITVSVPDGEATRSGDTATIRITRTGDPATALTVPFTVSGSAIAGLDYPSLGAVAEFGPGRMVRDLVIRPVDSGVPSDDVSVRVAALPSPDYALATVQGDAWIQETVVPVGLNQGDTQGAIDYYGDEDVFSFTVGVETDVTMEQRGSGTGDGTLLYPYLILYGPDKADAYLTAAYYYSTTGSVARIDRRLQPGTYYLRAGSYYGSYTGTYVVAVRDQAQTVSISAPVATAVEGGAQGSILISRAGSRLQPLTVALAIAGAGSAPADPAADIASASGSVVIPAGAESVAVPVAALADALVEGDEVLRITVQPSADYAITTASADVTIEEAGGRIIRVRSGASGGGLSWADAMGDLRIALQRTRPGDQVWVAEGVYTPDPSNRNQYFQPNADVTILGGFPASGDPGIGQRDPRARPTILSGNIGDTGTGADDTYYLMYLYYDHQVVIDGFILESAAYTNLYAYGCNGLAVSNCVVRGARGQGGQGGGLHVSYGTAALSGLLVTGNTAQTTGGGAAFYGVNGRLDNSVFVGNALASASGSGAGVYLNGSGLDARHLTIAGNTIPGGAAGQGGGLYAIGGAVVADSILCGNLPDQAGPLTGTGNADLTGSLIEGGLPASFAGAGTASGAAQFTDPLSPAGADGRFLTTDDGWSLAPGDTLAADLASASGPDADIARTPRPQGGNADRGAYERTTGSVVPDTTAPALAITAPAAGVVTNGYQTITGTVGTDAVALTWRMTGDTEASGTIPIAFPWSFSQSLSQGRTVLEIRARDAAGNTAVRTRTFDYQRVALATVAGIADRSGDPAVVRFTRTAQLDQPLTVDYTVSGSATTSSYQPLGGRLTVAAGAASGDLQIFAIDDGTPSDDRTLTVNLSASTGWQVGSPSSRTVLIGDARRTLALGTAATGAIDVAEDADRFTFVAPVLADYRIELRGSGSGVGTLYDPSLVLYGPDSAATEVARDEDGLGQREALIARNLAPGTYFVEVSGYSTYTGTYEVKVSLAAPTVRITAPDAVAGEIGPDQGRFTVSRIGDLSFPMTVDITWSGSVVPGVDTQGLPVSVAFLAGQAAVDIPVVPVGDALSEGDEFLVATLQPSAGFALGTPSQATMVLRDEYARTLYVAAGAAGAGNGTSWADAYPRLEQALAAALPGDQVWVAQGQYRPSTGTDQAASFQVGAQVSVFGGFAGGELSRQDRDPVTHPVILSGEIGTAGPGDNSDAVVVLQSGAVLDGVTVRDGDGTADGAGIRIGTATDVAIVNCRVVTNRTTANGAGLSIAAGGGATVLGTVFDGNVAGGNGGAIANASARSAFVNCVFTANAAGIGGAVYTGGALIASSTFSGNSATSQAAAVYTTDASIVDSILWGAVADQLRMTAAGQLRNAIVRGGTAGVTGSGAVAVAVSASSPLFVSAADPRLTASSPAIDAADAARAPGSDLRGAPRVGAPDLGAYEYGSTVPASVDAIAPVVAITGPTANGIHVQGGLSLTVAGTAGDDRGVVAVGWSLSGATGGSGPAIGLGTWSTGQLALNPGTTFVTVTVRDAAGNRATARLQVEVEQVSMQLVDQLAGETAGNTATVRLNRTGSAIQDLAVRLAWIPGAGFATGVDSDPLPPLVTIPAGQSSLLVAVAARTDGEPETGDESLDAAIAADPAYQVGAPSTQRLWFVDDTPTALIPGAAETAGSVDFTGTPSDSDRFTFVAGVPGTWQIDVRGSSSGGGTLAYPRIELYGPDDASRFVAAATYGGTGSDARMVRDLAPGTYVAVVSSAYQGYTGTYQASVRLVGSRVSVAAADPSATEGGDGGSVTVTRVGDFSVPLVVNLGVGGTAVIGTDAAAIPATVAIPASAAAIAVPVAAIANATPGQDDRSVEIALAAGTGYTVGSPALATVWIADEPVALALGTPRARQIGHGGDVDRFTFTVAPGATRALALQLQRTGVSPIANGTLALVSPIGAVVAQASGGSAFGREAALGAVLSAGTWTVRASGYYANETGSYAVLATANAVPTATADAFTLAEGGVRTGTLRGNDPEGAPLTVTVVNDYYYYGYHRGILNVTPGTGAFTYTPYPDQTGTDTFRFTVSDGILTSAEATVTFTITPVNDPPVGATASYVALAGSVLYGQLPGSDPDGDLVQRLLVSGPAKGTLAITSPAAGAFTYTPGPTATGADSFTWRLSDGQALSPVYAAQILIDRRPEITGTAITLDEDSSTAALVVASDPDGDPLTVFAGPAGHGSVVMTPGGSFTYTPAADFAGADSFQVWAWDGYFESLRRTVTVSVTPVNDAPRPGATGTVSEPGQPVPGQLTAYDPEGDPVTFEIVTFPSEGTLELDPDFATNGRFTYHPATAAQGAGPVAYGPLATGPVSFTYRMIDSQGLASPVQTYVIAFNQRPVISAAPLVTSEDTAKSGGAVASDPDNDPVTVSVSIQAAHGTVVVTNPQTGAYIYTPATDFSGSDSFELVAYDGTFTSDPVTVAVTVTPVNDAPAAVSMAISVPPGSSRAGILSASDPEGDPLTYAILASPSLGQFTVFSSTTGQFTYQATGALGGTETIAFRASDGSLISNTAVLTVYINTPPAISASSAATTEDRSVSGGVVASDADGDVLAFQAGPVTAGASLTVDPQTGAWIYQPPADLTGTDTFTIRVSDGKALAETLVAVLISGAQDAPVVAGASAAATAMPAVDRDDPAGSVLGVSDLIAALGAGTVSDPDGDPLGLAVTGTDQSLGTWSYTLDGTAWTAFPAVSLGNALLLPADGVAAVRLMPHPTAAGTVAAALRLRAWDRTSGTAGATASAVDAGGTTAFSTQSIEVSAEVRATAGLPALVVATFSATEDLALSELLQGTGGVSPYTFTLLAGATRGGVNVLADGRFDYQPDPDANGSDGFTVRIDDSQGGSATAAVAIAIAAVNDAPVATVDPALTGGTGLGETATASLGTWNDLKDQPTATITKTVRWQRATSAQGTGAANIAGATAAAYVIQPADAGRWLRAVVTARDNGVGTPAQASATRATAWIAVANTVPVIAQGISVSASMAEDGQFTAPVVIATDPDPQVLTWGLWTQAAHGVATVSGSGTAPVIAYTPAADYTGTDQFVVRVSDGAGGNATCAVQVTISAVNDPPVATTLPAVSGAPGAGAQWTATTGVWNDAKDGDPGIITFTRQWQRALDAQGAGLAAIPGATAASYTLTVADEGRWLRVVVVAADAGSPGSATASAASAWRSVGAPGLALAVRGRSGPQPYSVKVGESLELVVSGGQPPYQISGGVRLAVSLGATVTGTDLTGDSIADTGALGVAVALTSGSDRITVRDGALATVQIEVSATALPSATVATPVITPTGRNGETRYTAIVPGTPEGLARIRAALAGRDPSEARAFAWDAVARRYVELPDEPGDGLLPSHALFIATRIDLGIVLDGTPAPVPYRLVLQPGWNFVGLPPLDDGGVIRRGSGWTSHFTLYDEGGVDRTVQRTALIGDGAMWWDGAAYRQETTLQAGVGYWIRNNATVPLVLHRTTGGGLGSARSFTLASRGAPPAPPAGPGSAPTASASEGGGGGCGLGSGLGIVLILGAGLVLRLRLRRR